MPFDDYKCEKCGTCTIRYREITEDPLEMVECKKCSTKYKKYYSRKQIPTGVSVKFTGGPKKGKLDK